jgi:hypothetical protein
MKPIIFHGLRETIDGNVHISTISLIKKLCICSWIREIESYGYMDITGTYKPALIPL